MGHPAQKLHSDLAQCQAILQPLAENIKKVIVGKDDQIVDLICAWIAGGHVLIEDIPGTGKTMLVRSLAKSASVPFSRVQFTPDLLPSDILGASIFNQKEQSFDFRPGPVFTTLLLADEINRATPRTQSALLECMSEGQVSVEGQTRLLDPLFITVATQNPVEQLGTFPLPEAQMDRFMIQISMGYPGMNAEIQILKNQSEVHPIESLEPVVTSKEILWVKSQVSKVQVANELYKYIVEIVDKTRSSDGIKLGASPRASIAITRMAQARALFEGKNFITPELVQSVAQKVMKHRILLSPEAKMSGQTAEALIEQALMACRVPVVEA